MDFFVISCLFLGNLQLVRQVLVFAYNVLDHVEGLVAGDA